MAEPVKKLAGFDGTIRFTVVFTKAFSVLSEMNTIPTASILYSF